MFIPHLGGLFHPQFVAQSQKATWDLRNVRAPQKMRLHPIYLAFLFLSKATREWRGCAHPFRRARCSSHSFSLALFLLRPSNPLLFFLISFCLLTRLLLPYRPFCRHFSASLTLPSLFRSLVLRGNSPAPLRSFFHPLFLPLSHMIDIDIPKFRRHSGQYDPIAPG